MILLLSSGFVSLVGASFILRKKIQGYYLDRRCVEKKDLKGYVALVTGGNDGIGMESAVGSAERGAEVVIACRSRSKAAEAVKIISRRSNSTLVSTMELDLSEFESVQKVAQQYIASGKPLHILIANAGIFPDPERKLTKNGYEIAFQTNYLGHFMLINLLLTLMKESAKTKNVRIVNVSSGAHSKAEIHWEDINLSNNYSRFIAYGQSKLAQVMHAKELQKMLVGHDITIVSCTPGFTLTKIIAMPFWAKILTLAVYPLWLFVGRSPRRGAQTIIHCAISSEVKGGKYYSNCLEKEALGKNREAQDTAAIHRLWELSELMINTSKNKQS
eukprot:NODE_4870_length_1102_cov_35.354443_g4324_i0.p1 GENE.NODE_4870_length_1102_cov_35.354443_g4324_i0~~NODE_4870_length_1102_cov_35.354443_g4324_i0.p1  ORF type:complete len:330 (-),score=46.79 NODE_4870_length_1102_cov_35.354443_g4324_i0:51-1040(-)